MRQRRKDIGYRSFFVAFTIALVVLATCKATAGPDRVSILTNSDHIGFRYQGFNEQNPGVFLTWDDAIAPNVDFSVGAYQNSYARLSVMATASWLPIEVGPVKAGIFAGVAHYPINGRNQPLHVGDWIPMAGVQVIAGNFFIQAMPASTDLKRSIIAAGITFEVK